MKLSFRYLLLASALAWLFAPVPGAFAQTPKSAIPADAPASPAQAETPVAPPAAPAVETNAPLPAAAATAAPEDEKDPALRRIDTPSESAPRAKKAPPRRRGRTSVHGRGGNDRIAVGDNAALGKGEAATDVVAVFGSATSAGDVADSVVSILGNTHVTGPVGGATVAVLGSVYVNSKVGGEVVAIMGNVELGPEAEIGGEVVAIGGRVVRDPKAIVHGAVQTVPFGGSFGNAEWLRAWFTKCLMLARPLAIGPHLGWAWVVAFSFLAFYVLLALLFRRGFERCTLTLETRPGYSVLAAVLTVLLAPIAIVLLCATVVGIALVPFIASGLFFASLFGKAIMLAWIGRRFTKFFGEGPLSHPAFAVLLGGLILLPIYMVPVLGFLTYKLLGWLGLGVAVYTIVLSMKREKPPAPATASAAGVPVMPAAAPAHPAVAPQGAVVSDPIALSGWVSPEPAGAGATGGGGTTMGTPPDSFGSSTPPLPAPPPMVAASLPRAGFLIRLYALALDAVLVALLYAFCSSLLPGFIHLHGPPVLPLAIYAVLMWKLKGTTVGGIVCGLKVVRLDGREVDWGTAVVRTLGCFLSLAVVGLGFLWVAIDDDRQSWHDKIAGTIVVRVPKGVSLI